jgi:hypothetical protein
MTRMGDPGMLLLYPDNAFLWHRIFGENARNRCAAAHKLIPLQRIDGCHSSIILEGSEAIRGRWPTSSHRRIESEA